MPPSTISFQKEALNPQATRTSLMTEGRAVTYGEVLQLWQDDLAFVDAFAQELAASPHTAFFWETPPVTRATLTRPFEYVLLDAPDLAQRRPSPAAFREPLADAGTSEVISFPNLGGDAQLIVPVQCAGVPDEGYTHLAAFVRTAAASQVRAFWQLTGRTLQQHLSDTRTWLSSSGMGVPWLHLRLDSRPKYYHHLPYRHA